MAPGIFDKITASPSLIWVLPAIGFHIVNMMMGLVLAFQKRSKSGIRLHALLYASVIFCLISFLVMNQTHGENTVWDYLVGLYFITAIPLSKRCDVLVHAFLAMVGLTLLPLLIILQF